MFKKNLNTSDIIVDALSTVLTAAVKHLVIDRGIEYARTKVDEALTPPEIEKEPQDEVEEKENEDAQPTKPSPKSTNSGRSTKEKKGLK
ncbi:MAG: hypothetical protein DI610_04920 [Staphylococcus hominis]|nr:MAG: hypothetical protein DI610_04920 [Staphylococcus hominis]